ncbi:MAG TPA: hypothetical protein PLT43_06890 [Mesotoga sp.]|nr:hypothetical protein [Mesotoga sp.]
MPEGISYQDSSFKKVVSLVHPDVRQSYNVLGGVGGSKIEAGTIFGMITNGDNAGKVRPLGLTYITKTEGSAATTFEVADASVLKVGDTIKITAAGDALTITAVDTENNTFSVATEDALTADENDEVIVQDGSDVAFAVSIEPIDVSATAQPVSLLIHGCVYEEAISNVLLASQLAAAKSDLFARLWFVESY